MGGRRASLGWLRFASGQSDLVRAQRVLPGGRLASSPMTTLWDGTTVRPMPRSLSTSGPQSPRRAARARCDFGASHRARCDGWPMAVAASSKNAPAGVSRRVSGGLQAHGGGTLYRVGADRRHPHRSLWGHGRRECYGSPPPRPSRRRCGTRPLSGAKLLAAVTLGYDERWAADTRQWARRLRK
jgi:hypothetical protein